MASRIKTLKDKAVYAVMMTFAYLRYRPLLGNMRNDISQIQQAVEMLNNGTYNNFGHKKALESLLAEKWEKYFPVRRNIQNILKSPTRLGQDLKKVYKTLYDLLVWNPDDEDMEILREAENEL